MPDVNVGIKISDAAASAGKLSKVEKGLNNIDKANKNMSISFKKAAIAAAAFAAAAAAITALGLKFLKLGSDAAETRSKYERTLGSMTAETDRFLDSFNKISGLSREASENLVADAAHIAQGMGLAQDASARLAKDVLVLAGDLASFKNVGADRAVNAITTALTGEREALKSLGVVVSQVEVDQLALAQSGKTLVRELTRQEKLMASMTLITQRAGIAVGDLSATADSNANVMKQIGGAWRDLNNAIGKFIDESPAVTEFLKNIRNAIQGIVDVIEDESAGIADAAKMLGELMGLSIIAGLTGAMAELPGLMNRAMAELPLPLRVAALPLRAATATVGAGYEKGLGAVSAGAGSRAEETLNQLSTQEATFGALEPGVNDEIEQTTEKVRLFGEVVDIAGSSVQSNEGKIRDMGQAVMDNASASSLGAEEVAFLAAANRDATMAAEQAALANQRMAVAGIHAAAALFRVAQEGGGIGGIVGAGLSIVGGALALTNPILGAGLMAGGSVISSLGNKGEQPVRINRGQVNAIVQSNRDRKTGPDSVVVIVEQAGVEIARIEQELGRRERRDATNRIPSVPTPPHQGSLGSAYGGSTSSGTPRIGVPG